MPDPLPSDELAAALAEVARLRTMVGDCHCDKAPETTNGPEEDCPQHGRPVAEVWGLVKRAEAGWDEARAEVEQMREDITRRQRAAFEELRKIDLDGDDAPVWDEDAVVEHMSHRGFDTAAAEYGSDRYSDEQRRWGSISEDERVMVRAMMTAGLAVVREHLPTLPDRETIIAAERAEYGDAWDTLIPEYGATLGWVVGSAVDAVLTQLPGRSEAVAGARALRAYAADLNLHEVVQDGWEKYGDDLCGDGPNPCLFWDMTRAEQTRINDRADRLERGAGRG